MTDEQSECVHYVVKQKTPLNWRCTLCDLEFVPSPFEIWGNGFGSGKIRAGGIGAGRRFDILGPSVGVRKEAWTPVVYFDTDEPGWVRTSSVEKLSDDKRPEE